MRNALLPFAVAAGIVSFCLPAQAQVLSVYGTFTDAHPSGIHNGNSGTTSSGYSSTSYWAPGFGGGATFGVLPIGPVHVGLDLRGSSKPGTNGADLVLAGVRVGLKLPLLRIKPYVQASGGYMGTRALIVNSGTTGATETDHFAVYEILGGVDYKLVPFFDLRLIEIGGGKGYFLSGAGESGTNYSPGLLTVSTGVVFHF